MRLFNENVVPLHTDLPYNIIRTEKIQEQFLDMLVISLNGTDYIVEKIGSYGNDPVVLVPVLLDDQQYDYPFILISGKQEVVFNPENDGVPTYSEKTEEVLEVEPIYEDVEDIKLEVEDTLIIPTEDLSRILESEQIKEKRLENNLKNLRIKKEKLRIENNKKELLEYTDNVKDQLLEEFLNVSDKIQKELRYDINSNYEDTKKELESELDRLSKILKTAISDDLQKGLLESLSEVRSKLVGYVNKKITPQLKLDIEHFLNENISNLEYKVSRVLETLPTNDDLARFEEGVKSQIDEVEQAITLQFENKISSIKEDAQSLNDESRKHFIGLINESKANLIQEIRKITAEKPVEYVIESRGKTERKDFDDIQKTIDKKISDKIADEVVNLRKYVAAWGGGGGTVAMQFADGGQMGGNLTVFGTISASNYAGLPAGGSDDVLVSTKVRASSANWDATYNTVTNLSSTWGAGTPAGSSYDLQYNNGGAFGAVSSNVNTTTLYLTQRGDGVNSFVPSWEPLPQLGTITYFFQPTIADVLSYNRMSSTAYPTITSITSIGVVDGQLLATFITDLNNPNREFIPDGQYYCHLHAHQSAGSKDAFLRVEVWEVDSAGVDISNVALLGNSTILTNVSTELFIADAIDRYNLAGTTSRIAVKLYAVIAGGGSAPTIILDMGDGTDSRFNLPAPIVDTTNYVPYTGSTSNIDLGTYDISGDRATFNDIAVVGSISASQYIGIIEDDVLVSTKVRASSANWDNSYNTVNGLSSRWTTAYLELTGGTLTGSLSVGNLSSSGFTQSLGTFTAGAGYPTIPSGVRAAGVSILGFSNNFSMVGGNNVTDATRKFTRWGAAHYTNAEEPLLMMIGDSVTSSTADLYIGGGTGIANTFQSLKFYTAANATTVTGTERLTINSSGGLIFNETGADSDFRIEGDTDQYNFFSDASVDRIGIGTSTPNAKLTVVGNISATTAIVSNSDLESTNSANGLILKSPDNTRWRITIDDTGALTTIALP